MSIKNNILYLTSKIFSYININLIILILFLFLFIKSSAIAYNTNNSGVVFMYHRFGESDYPSTNITLKQFEEHLKEFSQEKSNVVALEFMIDAFNTKTDLKENTIAISVDDGYRSIITEAWPRMKKYGFPLTVFISTEPIDAKINGYL